MQRVTAQTALPAMSGLFPFLFQLMFLITPSAHHVSVRVPVWVAKSRWVQQSTVPAERCTLPETNRKKGRPRENTRPRSPNPENQD